MEKQNTAETSGFWNYLMPCGALLFAGRIFLENLDYIWYIRFYVLYRIF